MHTLQTRREKKIREQPMIAKEDSLKVTTKSTFKYDYFPGFVLCLKEE